MFADDFAIADASSDPKTDQLEEEMEGKGIWVSTGKTKVMISTNMSQWHRKKCHTLH